jgi:hypothetical protein
MSTKFWRGVSETVLWWRPIEGEAGNRPLPGTLQASASVPASLPISRPSTVRRADRILVIVSGEIVEEGTHDELLAFDGAYRKLCDLQFYMPEDGEAPTRGAVNASGSGFVDLRWRRHWSQR